MTTYDEARIALTAAPVQHDELDRLLEGIDTRRSILNELLAQRMREALEAELNMREVAARLSTLDAVRSALVRDELPVPTINATTPPTPEPEAVQDAEVPVDTADITSEPDSGGEGIQAQEQEEVQEQEQVQEQEEERPALASLQDRVLTYLGTVRNQSVQQIAEVLDVNHKVVGATMSNLFRRGAVQRDEAELPYLYSIASTDPVTPERPQIDPEPELKPAPTSARTASQDELLSLMETGGTWTEQLLQARLRWPDTKLGRALAACVADGSIVKVGQRYGLPSELPAQVSA